MMRFLLLPCAWSLIACASAPQATPRDRIARRLITGRTAVIAHRGGAGPDGTIACAGRSLAAGVTFIELDVRLTRDGEAVILHDPTVDRTTDGTGPVAEMTLEQVKRLDAGAKYRDPAEPDRSYAGERIPTPAEMIRFVGGRGIILLELKVADAADSVVAAVQSEQAFDRVVVRSADKNVLGRVKDLEARVQVGTMGKMPEENLDGLVEELKELGVVAFTAVAVERPQLEKFRSKGIAVWGSNTNDPAVMSKLIEAGVDGIITDQCPVLAELLKAQDPTAQPPLPPLEEAPRARSAQAALRTGLWMMPDFKATLPTGLREITREALLDVGVDFSLSYDLLFLLISAEYAVSGEIQVMGGSAQVGVEADLGELVFPLSLRGSAGVLFAELDVDESLFGDFDAGIGFLARLELAARVTDSLSASLWLDYRHVEFDFEPATVSGDDAAGGGTFAVGLSLGLHF